MWISDVKSVSIKDICARDRNIATSYAKLLIKIENNKLFFCCEKNANMQMIKSQKK